MTAQAMEKLIFNGKEVYMASEPLNLYLESLKEKPKLTFPSTACWRGYYGTWEIKDDKLYLIDFKGFTTNNPKREYQEVGMGFVFPNQMRVFAQWFSGEIRIPKGDMLKYVHGGYGSTFEEDLFLEFKNGKLVGQRTTNNILKAAEELINRKKIIPKKISLLTKILDLLKSMR
jgi:hypothetical protein